MSRFFICFLIFITFTVGCKGKTYQYPQDRSIANEEGILNDSLGFYFASSDFIDSSQYKFLRDSFFQNYFSANFYALKESVLFNHYLGKDLYRFTWLPSFDQPLVISISKERGSYFLNVKRLDRHPMLQDYIYSVDHKMDSFYMSKGYDVGKDSFMRERGGKRLYSVIKGDRKASIVLDQARTLTVEQWKGFMRLFDQLPFWKMKSYDWAGDADGAAWILEAHTRDRYKYIIRQDAGKKFCALANYLLSLAEIEEELY